MIDWLITYMYYSIIYYIGSGFRRAINIYASITLVDETIEALDNGDYIAGVILNFSEIAELLIARVYWISEPYPYNGLKNVYHTIIWAIFI